MISRLAAHSKFIACFIGYTFLLSGLCSFVYGGSVYVISTKPIYTGVEYRPAVGMRNAPVSGYKDPGEPSPKIKQAKKKLDIGGPSQPEMGAFKSVGADNMVDPFSGDFS